MGYGQALGFAKPMISLRRRARVIMGVQGGGRMKALAICVAHTFAGGLLVLLWLAASPAMSTQEQAATSASAAAPAVSSPAAPAAATAEERVVVEALAAKMAEGIRQIKAKSVVVLDFANADDTVVPLGQKLADEFNDALARDAVKFRLEPRPQTPAWKSTLFYYGDYDVGYEEGRDVGAKLAVFGKASLDGETVMLEVQGFLVDHPGHTAAIGTKFPTSPELKALTQSPPAPSAQAIHWEKGSKYGFPSCKYCPRADFSEEAKKLKFEGIVLLSTIVDVDGNPEYVTVQKRLGNGLDEKAIEAVLKWKFKPATGPDGKPVAVRVPIEVQFHLY